MELENSLPPRDNPLPLVSSPVLSCPVLSCSPCPPPFLFVPSCFSSQGFTFSFPMKQTALNSGKLICWTKVPPALPPALPPAFPPRLSPASFSSSASAD
eukprot:765660-Hanusia_phi.AAC.2